MTLRSGSQCYSAMVPPALIVVPPPIIDNYRLRMRQHCAVPNVLDKTRCLACRDPCTQTPAGEREHVKTGVCEACWDLLVAVDDPRRREAVTRCTRLASVEACNFVTTWISMNRVAPGGTLTCVEPLARHIIAVGTGMENLPNLWLPGQRP